MWQLRRRMLGANSSHTARHFIALPPHQRHPPSLLSPCGVPSSRGSLLAASSQRSASTQGSEPERHKCKTASREPLAERFLLTLYLWHLPPTPLPTPSPWGPFLAGMLHVRRPPRGYVSPTGTAKGTLCLWFYLFTDICSDLFF